MKEAVQVRSVTLTIEYRCDLEHLNVEEMLEQLREQGSAVIVDVQPHNDRMR